MATAIRCGNCRFTYGFTDDDVQYAGAVCPSCKTAAPRVLVDVDVDRPAAGRGSAAVMPIANYRAVEFPGDELFWTAARVWTLGLLEASLAP